MTNMLIVLNKDENSISFIDADSGVTEAKLPVDVNPHEIDVTRDGKTSFVTNSGGNTVSIIDNTGPTEIDRISHPLFHFPHGIGLSADESELFIAATRSNRVFVFDVPSREPKEVIETYQKSTHMIYFDVNKERIFIPNIGSDNITILDARDRSLITHLPVGRGPEGAGVHPDGEVLYVANQHDNNLFIIELDTMEVIFDRKLGTLPIRVAFSPDGDYVFIPNRESNDLSIVDARRPWEIKRIPTGVWPGGTVFSPAGDRAFVANNKTNDVSVIDVEGLKEVGRYEAGIHPDGMAFAMVPGKGE